MPESDFGSRVIGEEKVAAFKAQQASGQLVFGSRVVDGVAEVAAPDLSPAPAAAAEKAPEGYSTASIKKLLTDEPQQFDRLFALEVAREDRRKGALSVFRSAEQRREGGPRQEIIDQIDALLG